MKKDKKSNQPIKGDIIVNEIVLRQIQRSMLEIDKWRNAITSAESIMRPNRTYLYEMYFEADIDAHITSVTGQRKDACSNIPISFTENGKENEEIMNLIRAPFFRRMIKDIWEYKRWGITCLEFKEFYRDNIVYSSIDRRYIIPEKGIIVKNLNDTEGWEYRTPPYCNRIMEVGDPKDLGLLMKAMPYVIYKRNGLADLSQYSEQFGQPIRKATYNPYDPGSRYELKTALDEAGNSLIIIIPEGTNLELIYPNNITGSADLYDRNIKINDAQISKLFLHQTLTTEQGDNGARSLGEVHADVAQDIFQTDRLDIIEVLNFQFKEILRLHGYNVGNGIFQYQTSKDVDLEKKIVIDRNVKEMGVPMSDDYFYETYDIPKPDNYDELKAKAEEEKKANAYSSYPMFQNLAIPPTKKDKSFFDFFLKALNR
ncbi:DUF935 domain-containing protein [Bacteroidales bacterium OttesenSCG-928-C19]|nr:DUF935 domain-containing protein [Bacteroidales bacterium OttesenSCG-928-C19]